MANSGPVSSYCDKTLNLPFVRDKDKNKAHGRLVHFMQCSNKLNGTDKQGVFMSV